MGIILGTLGHKAEGTREKAIPNTIIITMANHHVFRMGRAKSKNGKQGKTGRRKAFRGRRPEIATGVYQSVYTQKEVI